MALLSLDRHDVLETIRQSDSLHEAFLRVAKLPAVGEYKTLTNADRIRTMTDEELAAKIEELCQYTLFQIKTYAKPNGREEWLNWLKQEATK